MHKNPVSRQEEIRPVFLGERLNRADRRERIKQEKQREKFEKLPLDAKLKKALGDKPTNLGKHITSAQRKKTSKNRRGRK